MGMDSQTDTYLEELTERTAEFEAETQTDFLLDRPTTPLFIPGKSGVDNGTQIEENDLFDFEAECEPILEVLVGQTIEKAIRECGEEEELEAMRRHQAYYNQLREQELLEVQRIEGAERRKHEEMCRRKEQEKARKALDDAVLRKVLSRALARSYLSGLPQRCFEELEDAGIFRDNYLTAVEGDFMPWLLGEVKDQVLQKQKVYEKAVNIGIAGALKEKNAVYQRVLTEHADLVDEVEQAEQRVRDERQEERRIAKMEEKRIKEEQERLRRGEGSEEWVTTKTVAGFEGGVLTFTDESVADVAVPSDLTEELAQRIAESQGEEGNGVPVDVKVNMSKKVVVEIVPAPPPVPAAAEEGGEA